MNIVPMHTTPFGAAELRTALLAAGVPAADLHWAMGQIALETATGSQAQNWNVGNITANKSYGGAAWVAPWVDNPQHSVYPEWSKGRAPTWFRAYSSLAEGAADYWRRLKGDFPEIIAAWRTGAPLEVFRAIRRRYMPDRMSTAREAQAFDNFADRVNWARKELGQPPIPKAQPPAAGGALEGSPLSEVPPSSWLQLGSSGPAVVELRQRLTQTMAEEGTTLGPLTDALLRAYQVIAGLKPDGKAGPLTRGKLNMT